MHRRSLTKVHAIVCLVVALAALSVVASAAPAWADPSEDLATAEQEVASAEPAVATAHHEVQMAKDKAAPAEAKEAKAHQAVLDAQEEVTLIEAEIEEERSAAAKQVVSAEKRYEDEQSSHDSAQNTGIGLVVLGLIAAGVGVVLIRLKRWKPGRPLKVALGIGSAALVVAGIVVAAAASSPSKPTFSAQTRELAKAPSDPSAEPPAKLEAAQAKLASAESAAAPIEEEGTRLNEQVEAAEAEFTKANAALTDAEEKESRAKNAIAKAKASERKEAEFREEATTIDYNQLIKNPNRYKGEKVVYEGQVFQIQEEAGVGIMLLSVTNEGYGFWTNNIWVNFFEPIEAAEEDIITVYGKITGSEEYETQIGGSTFVPRMNAVYIEE